MKIFYRKSWWRSALALLLIMCMMCTMLVATTVESHASVTLTGLACSAVIGLTIGALLAGSGVPMTEENSVPLINAFYWGCDAEQLAIIESFSPGQAIGDLFDAVSGWFTTHLNTGNIFYSNDVNETLVFPVMSFLSPDRVQSVDTIINSPFKTDSYKVLGCDVTYVNTYPGYFNVKFLDGTVDKATFSFGSINYFNPFRQFVYDSSTQVYKVRYHYSLSSGNDNTYYSSNIVVSPDSSLFPSNLYWYLEYIRTGTMSESADIGTVVTIPEYLPTSTDTEKALVTTTPVYVPQTWEQLWDSTPQDIREGTFTGGEVVNPDLPIEGSTSGTISGEGAGTGVFEGVGSWLLDLPVLGDILGALKGLWDTVKDLLATVGAIATSVASLASGDVPAELEMKINEFSGQLFDLLSFNELSQSMEALQNFESGYGEPPKITVNLHSLADTAQRFGKFENEFADEESVLIDFEILEDSRFGFMGLPLIEWIRLLSMISMVWYTAWYVWDKIVPRNAIE